MFWNNSHWLSVTFTHQMPLFGINGIIERHAPLRPAKEEFLRVPSHVRVDSQGLSCHPSPPVISLALAQQVVSLQLPNLPAVLQANLLRDLVCKLIQVMPFLVQVGVQPHGPRLSRAAGGGWRWERGGVW